MGMREPGGTWRRGAWFRARAAGPGGGQGTDLGAGGGLGARPRVASRPSGWPVLRTPKWMLAAGVVLVAGLTLAAIPHQPSPAQRAADLPRFRRPARRRQRPTSRHPSREP